MQLSRKKSIRNALAVATCGLLSQAPLPAQAVDLPWKIDLSSLYYSEKDRVTVSESIGSFRREIGNDEAIALKFSYDTISGASANGAVFNPPQSGGSVQTVTSPSGASRTLNIGGAATVDPLTQFKDTRIAAQIAWEKLLGRTVKGTVEGDLSFENDYDSYGGGGNLAWDLFQRMTTLTGGVSINKDTVRPIMGNPPALKSIADPTRLGQGEKRTIETMLGVSQVVNRTTLTQLNYSRAMNDGYLTDPYKIITVTDAAGVPVDYLYEKRPTSRVRNSVYWNTAHHFTEDVVHFAYRYYWDDWGIRSHTADLHYRMEIGRGHYLQTHLRYYTQMEADFYRYSLADGAPLPSNVSADYRLGKLVTQSVGLKYGFPVGKKMQFSLRGEYMRQSDVDHRFPAVDVIMVQATLSFSDIVDYALFTRPPP